MFLPYDVKGEDETSCGQFILNSQHHQTDTEGLNLDWDVQQAHKGVTGQGPHTLYN